MKFGRRIKESRNSAWEESYLDYNGLKKELKAKSSDGNWTEENERKFVKSLEDQLRKCEVFQRDKAEELSGRIADLERQVIKLCKQYDAALAEDHEVEDGDTHEGHADGAAVERQGNPDYASDGGSDDDADDADYDNESDSDVDYEERFQRLDEESMELVYDVHSLAMYTKLNFTGFIKIVKKHDKVTGFTLKAEFSKEYLDKHPFYKYNYDGLIVKLSRLVDLIRTKGHPVEGDSSAGGSQSAFVRSTTKYWVHDDNIVHLKLAILKHLPVLVFNSKKEFEPKDAAITSIYFDNEDLELYLGRLEKTEGAEAIRLRWYGDENNKTIFVERKTHREDWTGEKSVKARFAIKEDKVNDFLAGRYHMDDEFAAMVKSGKKTQHEVDSMKQLADEVQYAVLTRKLQPVMRSFYNRTAFQLPGDARVRISLDTELTMVREDDFDGRERAGKNWRRTDIGIDHPFDQLPKADRELFPYAVLEVKLQTQLGQEPPEWIRELIASHLVEAVPKFSKFIHGCATLISDRVDLVPFWLPQMELDIRKDPGQNAKLFIERPHSANQSSNSNPTASARSSPRSDARPYLEPVSEGEDDEPFTQASANEEKRLGLPPTAYKDAQEAKAFREQKLRDEAKARPNGNGAATANGAQPAEAYGARLDQSPPPGIGKHVSQSSFQQLMRYKARNRSSSVRKDNIDEEEEDQEEPPASAVQYVKSFTAPAGKKISMPVRVEPKVHFANERTFLKWLHFAVLLGTVATTLLNFVPADDKVGRFSAGCFTITALLAIVYSGGMYTYRVLRLRKRAAIEWHDPYGPTALCGAVIASVAVNLVLRLREI